MNAHGQFTHRIKSCFLEAILCCILYICYRKIIGAHSALILTAFLILYGGTMAVSEFAERKLLCLERQNKITANKLFYLSAMILCPIYLFWFLFSMIPIFSYEVWLITGFPIILVSCIPLHTLSDYWKKVSLFWLLQLLVYGCCLAIGQILGKAAFGGL